MCFRGGKWEVINIGKSNIEMLIGFEGLEK